MNQETSMRSLREERGMTLVQIAAQAGVAPATVAKFELTPNSVRPIQRAKIARVYTKLVEVS